MAIIIVMPRLSPTMEEGVLIKWTKKPGDRINPGDVIAEVETDKANMDFPLEDEGTLLKLLVAEGESVKLGAPVAVLGEPGEDPASALASAGGAPAASAAPSPTTPDSPAPDSPAPESPAPDSPAPETPAPTARTGPPASPKQAQAAAAAPAAAVPGNAAADDRAATPAASGGLRASPLARKLAFERGIDLNTVNGSGPSGRVVKRDVEAAAARPAARAPATTPAAARPAAPPPALVDQVLPLSPMRRTIARRLSESKSTVPHFYVVRDVRAEALFDLHAQLKQAAPDLKVTLNDLVLKATATALARMPEANASWSDQGIVRHGSVHLGIAVSLDDGLVTPVLRDAQRKSIGQISVEARDLIERARARKLRADEFTGATFSVSNMGMLGVREFSAVINPPESGILAVGAAEKRAVVESDGAGNDTVAVQRAMTLTISADHRVLDGAVAAKLLAEIVTILERPLLMMV